MPKLKLVKRQVVAAKAAAAGSGRTGAKVEKTKEGKGVAGSAAGRFTGRTTGLSVTKYQNKTILENPKHKYDDEQLVALWKKEFPNAKSDYTVEIVRGVRSLVNRGKHGNDEPRTPVPQYIDGEAQPFRGEKTAARREAAEERPAPAKKAVKKVVKKGR